MRERRKVRKSEARSQRRTERILPLMLVRRAVRRPYLSERVPIIGDAAAWRRLGGVSCGSGLDRGERTRRETPMRHPKGLCHI